MATKLRRGMIFTRIRVGGIVKPWTNGEKNPCVIFPCFIQPPPLKIVAVSWGSYGWEWSMAGLSVLAHTHTPPTNRTSRWAEEMTLPIIPLSPRLKVHTHTLSHFPFLHCLSSSRRETSCSSWRGFFLFGLTQQGGESFWLSFMFST